MFNLKDHKGRTRGLLVVRGPQFEKRCPTVFLVYGYGVKSTLM